MTLDVGAETEAYAAYLNARPRAVEHFEPDELALFEEDLAKARAQMEAACLDQQYAKPRRKEPACRVRSLHVHDRRRR